MSQSGLWGRALSPFESIHALVSETSVMAIRLTGTLDTKALTTAWAATVRENPVLTGRIEIGADGLYLAVDAGAVTPPTTGRVNPADLTTTPIALGRPVAGLDVTAAADAGRWVSLLTHHSIADGTLMYHWFSTLWQKYARRVGETPDMPEGPLRIPAAPESLLAERGVAKGARTGAERLDGIVVHPFRDPVGRAPGHDPLALHRLLTVLSIDDTSGLRAVARARNATLHGLICGAILLAERELLDADGSVPMGLISHVNIRKWLDPPAADADGTNVLGYSCAQVAVGTDGDPRATGDEVLEQLRIDLDEGVVQQTCLHIPEIIARWASNDNLEPISVSNMGEFEPLSLPAGLEVCDFGIRGNANYAALAGAGPPENLPLSTGRHHAVFSYAGRLHLQTMYPAAVLTAERAEHFRRRICALLLAMVRDG